ncbi:MAG: lactate utilization protein [bacterium]|nr:lactate utilization protein [bacterium]
MTDERLIEAQRQLRARGYEVSVFESASLAAQYLDDAIDGQTVGMGGSVTLHQLRLFELLSAHNTVYWHDEKPDHLSVMETRTAAARADIYISSVNAISQTGEIVNIDHTGNRVAAISYGPGRVYLVAGVNKLAPTLEDAIHRARHVAAPLNAQRLKRKTPCAVHGDRCYDCRSPERICRNLSILLTKPAGSAYEVLLINESLGY